MQSWPAASGASASAQTHPRKGRGKGRGFERDRSNPKRFRSDTPDPMTQLVYNSAELSLQNARNIRALLGLAVVTLLCPACPAVVKASQVEVDMHCPIMSDILRWKTLVCEVVQIPDLPSDILRVLNTHASQYTSPEQLFGLVLMCNVVATFDHDDLYKIQIKVSPALDSVATALVRALNFAKATCKFGAGPRTKAERQTADSLKAVRGY
eukprot:TRINITY_DN61309_c0_g1_i1.p1 TRINITY_DN61309_c0_g1~~TRINITY_DN61309_c0_g1_i1.p1  ORF type:complete len:210 (+),score=21.62 TRINITY_DN61309_c0_g1_i1:41-670(+)